MLIELLSGDVKLTIKIYWVSGRAPNSREKSGSHRHTDSIESHRVIRSTRLGTGYR